MFYRKKLPQPPPFIYLFIYSNSKFKIVVGLDNFTFKWF